MRNLMRYLPVLLCGLLGVGCISAQTRFDEMITDEMGQPMTTSYSASTIVPLFMKADFTNHGLSYASGGEENVIVIGQDSKGLDAATGAVEAMKVFADALNQAYMFRASQPVDPPDPTLLTPENLQLLIEILRERQAEEINR